MEFNLDAGSEGEWFPFQKSRVDINTEEVIWEEPEPEAKVLIRNWKPFFEKQQAERKMVSENIYNPKTRGMERITHFKDLTSEEIWAQLEDAKDYGIMDMKGFVDTKTKEPIECTRENKLKALAVPMFDRFFARCMRILENSGVERKEAAEKN